MTFKIMRAAGKNLGIASSLALAAVVVAGPSAHAALAVEPTAASTFSSGFEEGDPLPTGFGGGDVGPVNNGSPHTGQWAAQYLDDYDAAVSTPHSTEVFNLSNDPVAIGEQKSLSYWVFPKSSTTSLSGDGAVSTCAALNLEFTDGSTLTSADGQCDRLEADQWNHVTVDLAANNSNKEVKRITFEVDGPDSGRYDVVIDDITIS